MKLSFTKFFDVKAPQTKFDEKSFNDIGVDVYFPRPTEAFFNKLIELNKKEKIGGEHGNRDYFVYDEDGKHLKEFGIYKKSGISEPLIFFRKEKYNISRKISIPTGIGLLIPKNYYVDLRSKSSNFKYDYTSIKGTIDEAYTYGMSVQILPLTENNLYFEVDEKFAQIVLHKSEFIEELNEIKLEDWENHEEVKARRLKRNGGFGSTGKFDTDIKVQVSQEVEKQLI